MSAELIAKPTRAIAEPSNPNLSIQALIHAAAPNSTVSIPPGVYTEHDIIVDKPLIITSQKPLQAVIDLNAKGSGFVVRSNEVTIDGFTINNSGMSFTNEVAAIKISDATSCTVKNNKLDNNAYGIYLANTADSVISHNKIMGTGKSEGFSGNGIHLWNSRQIKISNNEVHRNRDGIYLEFVKESTITSNLSHQNVRYGLHFMYSPNNEYRENTFRENEGGVAVMYSKNIRMFRNHFDKNYGPSSYGILLKEISDSVVAGNRFSNNSVGIFAEGTTRTLFEGNLFSRNGWALRVLGDTDTNTFTKNDFIANTFDLATNATQNMNRFDKNYWSKYHELDLNGDGIGDRPYLPVSLSSKLMERYHASVLLLNSFFFSILDQIEKAFPLLTSDAHRDDHPLMKRATAL